jgi:DNA modification methylase
MIKVKGDFTMQPTDQNISLTNLTTDATKEGVRLAIEYASPSSLKTAAFNPRVHTKEQIGQLKHSIKTFDFVIPVLIDENRSIIAGHARVLAAQMLGLKEIPVVQVGHLSPMQIKALMIADNRISENASWDDKTLGQILKDLQTAELDFSIEVTGFTFDDIELRIESLEISTEGALDPDDQIEAAAAGPVVSAQGDLWLLGKHCILHGDATVKANVERLFNGNRAAMTFTDPPYGVDYANSAKDKMRGTDRPILNDNLRDEFPAFLSAACANILSVTDGGAYICMSSSALHLLQEAFVKAGGHWSTFIIWAKQTFTLGRADYQRQYEPILYGWREGAERHWCGARDQGDVWFINKPVKNDLHPTMKPVELVMRAIRNSSKRGDIVFDPFLGSGSSLIASERTGRHCYGLELDGQYVDATIRRWQAHTGEDAVHVDTGRTFNDITREKGNQP